MATIYDLEPKAVFSNFAKLCEIPHGSGNVKEISDFLADFARNLGYKVRQDEALNVFVEIEATEGYENVPGIIIQGHMDMVAVSKPELPIDMTKDPLNVKVDGDNLYAEGTSLGGDDGIAVAYAMAIMEDKTIPHPHLDILITTDEETGMDGARAADISGLKGTRLFNLDSEDEGHFLVGCAGGARVDHFFEAPREARSGAKLEVKVTGLQGGHSGAEINKERGNANVLMGRVLKAVAGYAVGVYTLEGGVADNAITRECVCDMVVASDRVAAVKEAIRDIESKIKVELATKDPGFQVVITDLGEGSEQVVENKALSHIVDVLIAMPNGVQAMSADVEGLVQTSLNNGIMKLEGDKFSFVTSVRSSIASEKKALIDRITTITRLAGGKNDVRADYPGWAYRVESPFRDLCMKVYKDMYQQEPIVEAIHAGVECGFFLEKRPDLDCVSIGPNMKDIHTTEERLSISSAKRTWEDVLAVLAAK